MSAETFGADAVADGAAITTLAPRARNSRLSWRLTSTLRLSRAEMTAPPLVSASSATIMRTRLPRNKCQSRRLNIIHPSGQERAKYARHGKAGSSFPREQPRLRRQESPAKRADAA